MNEDRLYPEYCCDQRGLAIRDGLPPEMVMSSTTVIANSIELGEIEIYVSYCPFCHHIDGVSLSGLVSDTD